MVRLTPGFEIHSHEMSHLTNVFRTISNEYRDALPNVIAIPHGGGAGIDRAMATTLKTINHMHTVLYEAIGLHRGKLDAARKNYVSAEINNGDAAEQVRKAVAAGESVRTGEEFVVSEYLGGAKPAYMTPGPIQPVQIIGAKEAQAPDGRPTLATVPDAVKPTAHKPWVQIQYQILAFDYPGLWRLTDDLNAFVAKADPSIIELAKRVESFCSPYRNYGDAVYQFNATFSQDANLASGFHKIVSTVSATVDTFANAMAEKEAWLEWFAHRCGIPESFLASIVHGQSKQNLDDFFSTHATSVKKDNFAIFYQACQKVMLQAEKLRTKAASQLLFLADTIATGGLDYYTKKDTRSGSADPGGLFNGENGHSPELDATDQLEREIRTDAQQLKASDGDLNDALGGIAKVGGYGGQVGGLMGGIQGVNKAKGLFGGTKAAGDLAGTAGPILQTLGLLLFVE